MRFITKFGEKESFIEAKLFFWLAVRQQQSIIQLTNSFHFETDNANNSLALWASL